MTFFEKAKRYGKEPMELKEILTKDTRNKRFFEQHDLEGNLDSVCERAIDEIMQKYMKQEPSEPPAPDLPAEEEIEKNTEPSQEIFEDYEQLDILEEPALEEIEKVKSEDIPKRKTRSKRKKSAPTTEIPSEIDSVPCTVLRRFYAENFSVKPEKIFFMDDDSVREKISEKYIVVEREADYLFLKRATTVVSVSKEE